MNRLLEALHIDRKHLPLMETIGLFILMFLAASLKYKGFFSPRVLLNLLIDNAFLLVSAIGTTFVILSGGIDLSVGAVIALTAMVSAWMVEELHISPAVTIPTVLLMGALLGAGMGSMIQWFKIPPFIATLAGMFLARGLCFVISVDAISITHPFYKAVSKFRIQFPDKSFISINVVIALVTLAAAVYLAHYTRFGRAVYAIGGNEPSARLMGLPVPRTKILVYTLNGFCSALAGVVFSFYVLSGYGLYVNGLEMDVISSVVIGGPQLTGGVG